MFELSEFLVWLICVGISAILIGYTIKYYGMEDTILKSEGFVVYACPPNTVKYITRNGETNCCNGDIVNNQCNGNNLCSLSPTNSLGLQKCQTYLKNLANEASAANCFTDMPYYFASNDGSLRGCSLSQATPDGTAPSDPTKLQCILYPTDALDKLKLDSCYNYKLNKAAKSGANCPVVPAAAAAPVGPANPTGYVIYGGGISGNLPVTKIIEIEGSGPGGTKKGLFAQDGQYIRSVVSDGTFSKVLESFAILGNISSITNIQSIRGLPITSENYNLKKVDPSNPAPAAPAVPAAAANPTGYVIYGEGISGNLAVTKIIELGGPDPIKVLLAQDGKYARMVVTDPTISYRLNSLYGIGNISTVNDNASIGLLESVKQVLYNVKKADGSAPLPPPPPPPPPVKPTPPSSTNPNDYVLNGGNPAVSNLQVSKILFDEYNYYFFAQNGENINYTVLKIDKTKFVYYYSGRFKGTIAEITDIKSYQTINGKEALPGSNYTAKKKDGSEIYAPDS
jgi:hypothetical protein